MSDVAYLYIIVGLVSLFVAYALTPVSGAIALKLGAMDHPGERKIHGSVIPRLGGLAIFAGVLAGFAAYLLLFDQQIDSHLIYILIGAALLMVVGMADDLYQLSSKQKLLGQIIAVALPVISGPRVEFFRNPFGGVVYLDEWLSIAATLIWIVAIINTVNLIDGMDGLAAGVVAIGAAGIFATSLMSGANYAVLALVLSAACLGFLRHNFYPATIFMGDSGSMFLGYVIGVLTVVGMSKSIAIISLFIPLMVMGIPIFDTAFAILRRAAQGLPITQADDGHLHHRLLRVGNSQRTTVLIIYAWSLILSVGAVGLKKAGFTQSIFILMFVMLISIVMTVLIAMGERVAGFGLVWNSIRRFSWLIPNGKKSK